MITPVINKTTELYQLPVSAATKLLLSVEAHLDQGNNSGATPLDYFKDKKRHVNQKGLLDPYIDAMTCTVLPLSCLSAQVIRKNSIPFQDQQELPIWSIWSNAIAQSAASRRNGHHLLRLYIEI